MFGDLMAAMLLGLDIGGTKLAGGLITPEDELIERRERPTRAAEGVEVSLGEVYALLEELAAAAKQRGVLEGIGICAPGPLDPETGVIFNPTNMPGWVNLPLARDVARRFQTPCFVENDANGAGLGEAMFGAARGFSRVFYATLSTGIETLNSVHNRVPRSQHDNWGPLLCRAQPP